MFFQDMIQSQSVFGDPAVQSFPGCLHVAFGIDKNYARCMGVLIVSLQIKNASTPIIFHIFADSVEDKDLLRISHLIGNHNTFINIYYINKSKLATLPSAGHISTATYIRIIMPEVLHPKTPRFLYLDSDIICLNKVPDLNTLEMKDNAVAAVQDVDRVKSEKISELRIRHGLYFNAGVLLIDTQKWRQNNISHKVLDLIVEKGMHFSLFDQDALNIVLDGNVMALPSIWNQIYDLGQMTHDPLPDSFFLHYTGEVKPWRLSGRHRLSALYRDMEARSPWTGSPLLPPNSYKEMEIYARLSLRDGDIATGLLWYWKYLKTKFF